MGGLYSAVAPSPTMGHAVKAYGERYSECLIAELGLIDMHDDGTQPDLHYNTFWNKANAFWVLDIRNSLRQRLRGREIKVLEPPPYCKSLLAIYLGPYNNMILVADMNQHPRALDLKAWALGLILAAS